MNNHVTMVYVYLHGRTKFRGIVIGLSAPNEQQQIIDGQ